MPPRPPDQNTLPNLLGQDHNYSVILRGNGEAIVTGKMTFSNNSDQEMTTIDLESPIGKLTDNFVAYQQERQGSCISHALKEKTYPESPACSEFKSIYECDTAAVNHAVYNCSWYACVNKCLTTGTPIESVCPDSECSQYQEPDYFIDSFNTKNIYQKLKSSNRGNFITLKLNKKVRPQQSGSIIFYYTQNNIAKKNIFGAYDFNFETLKVDDKIRKLSVGISTDPDYFLKDAKGKIDYRQQETVSTIASNKLNFNTGITSPQMDSYYSQIGYGQITKTATNLQSNESYKVKGSYSDSQWKLYAGETIRNILVFLIALIIFIFIVKIIIGKIFHGFSGITTSPSKKTSTIQNTHPLILSVCLSFASSLIILISLLVFIFLTNSSIFYNYSPYYTSNLLRPLMVMTITIILLCVDILALFLPTIFMWKKAGSTWGIATFVLNIMWFFFYLVATFLIVFLFSMGSVQNIIYSPPMSMMKGIE